MPSPSICPSSQRALIHGDALSQCIAAASILAKVTRDACMREWDLVFPQYGLKNHKGYSTDEHWKALETHGPTPMHRFSFWPVREHSPQAVWTGYPRQGDLFVEGGCRLRPTGSCAGSGMRPVEPKMAGQPDHPGPAPARIRHTWYHKLGIFLFIIVCFEVGAFLAVFPWTPQWDTNSVANLLPWLRGRVGQFLFPRRIERAGTAEHLYFARRGTAPARVRRVPPPSDRRPPADKLPPPINCLRLIN